jgi:hypothetical protein
MYKTIYTEVEVDVDLSEFDTDDLLEELESRGKSLGVSSSANTTELLEKIWILRREGKEYQTELDSLIYNVLGKII